MRRLLPLLVLALVACDDDDGSTVADEGTDLTPSDADPTPDGGDPDGALDAAPPTTDAAMADAAGTPDGALAPDGGDPDGEAPPDGGDPDGALTPDGAAGPVSLTCPLDDLDACGGDLEGEWRLVDFCTADGPASEPRDCEGPGEDEAACQGGINERSCTLQYGGTATFEGGQLTARFSAGIAVRYVFDDDCLAALAPLEAPAEGCAGFGNDRLRCDYGAGACRCEAQSEPEGDENGAAYAVDGDAVTIGGAPGRFCTDGRRLAIRFDGRGPEGWHGWTFIR